MKSASPAKSWALGLGFLAIVGAALIIRGGFQPDGYLIHVLHQTGPQPYPIRGVGFFLATLLVESGVLFAVMGLTSRAPIARLFLALLLFLGLTAMWGMGSMHQAPYFFGHLFWLLIVDTVLLVMLVLALVRRLLAR